jgi:hypothetical protein
MKTLRKASHRWQRACCLSKKHGVGSAVNAMATLSALTLQRALSLQAAE